jgi:DNA (cytosine-5)-methyltransferase 1
VDSLNELSLFSGAGGGLLGTGALLGWTPVCFVEWDRYASSILAARIADGFLHDAPIWDDVFTFDGRPWRCHVDVVSAGFPCQPFSVAGANLGESDPRNGWPATRRIIGEVGPSFIFLENVPGLLAVASRGYFGKILGELSDLGFDVKWEVVSAKQVGAPHERKRLWIYGYNARNAHDNRQSIQSLNAEEESELSGVVCRSNPASQRLPARGLAERTPSQVTLAALGRGDASDAQCSGPPQPWESGRPFNLEEARDWQADQFVHDSPWAVEPGLDRMAYGVASRVDRIKAIGNGQVPLVAALAWRRLHGPS